MSLQVWGLLIGVNVPPSVHLADREGTSIPLACRTGVVPTMLQS